MPTPRIEVSTSSDDGAFCVELLGEKLTRSEATALTQRLITLLGLDAGARAEPPAAGPPAKFSRGLAPGRLDRFLRATSDRPLEPERPLTPEPSSVAPIRMGEALVGPRAEPPRPMLVEPERRAPQPQPRDACSYVHGRAQEWWKRSSEPGLEQNIRAEARAIAAELFEIAVALEGQ